MEENTLTGGFDNLARVMNDYGAALQEAYRAELEARGKNASGELSRRVRYVIEGGEDLMGGFTFEVCLGLPAYWFNVEYGRKPTPPSKGWVPVDRLIEWIRVKPVIPRPDDRGRIPTEKQLAYLINRAINDPDRRGTDPPRPGIAPTPVLKTAVDVVNAKYDPLIKAAVTKDLQAFMKSISFSDFRGRTAARKNVVKGPHKRY